jgi:uncharacterized membrane protein (DUF485 family)
MDDPLSARIHANPKYRVLVRRRARLAWGLTALLLVSYYGYVGLIAFDKPALARPIGSSVITVGIPVGLGLIVLAIVLTGIYVVRANTEFDRLTREILDETGA